MNRIKIVDLRIDDIDLVRSLKLRDEQKGLVDTPESALALSVSFKRAEPFGVYVEERIIGFGIRERLTGDDEGGFLLWDFMIDKDYQGNGYGKRAISIIAQCIFEESGGSFIKLGVVPGNTAAMQFYKKLGFEELGTINEDGELELILKRTSL